MRNAASSRPRLALPTTPSGVPRASRGNDEIPVMFVYTSLNVDQFQYLGWVGWGRTSSPERVNLTRSVCWWPDASAREPSRRSRSRSRSRSQLSNVVSFQYVSKVAELLHQWRGGDRGESDVPFDSFQHG